MLYEVITFIAVGAQAQTKTIKGRIVDDASQAGIAYTNIGIEGTFYGTASDADGYFELKVPDEFQGQTLFVSAVGYENQNLPVAELFVITSYSIHYTKLYDTVQYPRLGSYVDPFNIIGLFGQCNAGKIFQP